MFDKFKDMYKWQKQAKTMQKELQKTVFTAHTPDEMVHVEVNGALELVNMTIKEGAFASYDEQGLAKTIIETIEKAMTKAKKSSSEAMRKNMPMSGMPGM
ncbi:MAG: nucleoid-associated protein, YbaB/EbfC family [Candidatus Abawacabacteria bacterium RBG_16_42_10]|uniref:Nucleoid-associated protein, YbaB/EbfC family n=1 Tax=Candidatus Abawacabacteria bacterium RBG_16_42_10 TaxID=1817814 RepID=A0A1F4XIH9_9BACT|nr:MAG: nucleoid-associated protein, YbaB/EbfC family [Candidatus Abawacabacteria bacterium RBG_16_42_10]